MDLIKELVYGLGMVFGIMIGMSIIDIATLYSLATIGIWWTLGISLLLWLGWFFIVTNYIDIN